MPLRRSPSLSYAQLVAVRSLTSDDRAALEALSPDGAWSPGLFRAGCRTAAYMDVQPGAARLNTHGVLLRSTLDAVREAMITRTVVHTGALRIHVPMDEQGMPDFMVDSPRFPIGASRVHRQCERSFVDGGADLERHVALSRGDTLRLLACDGHYKPDAAIQAWAAAFGYRDFGYEEGHATPALLRRLDVIGDTRHLDTEAWVLMTYLYAVDFLALDGIAIEGREGAQEVMLRPECLSGRDLLVMGQMHQPYLPDELLSCLNSLPAHPRPLPN